MTGAPEGTAYRVKSGNKEVDFDGFDQGVLLVAEEKLAGALRKMFKEARLPIEVVHVSPAPRGGAVQ